MSKSSLIRKLLPRKIYHALMYYSLPKIYRWGEDDHYYMDEEYSRIKEQMPLNGRLAGPKLLKSGLDREREKDWDGADAV